MLNPRCANEGADFDAYSASPDSDIKGFGSFDLGFM